MANELSDAIGKNAVKYKTNNNVGHIDLRGKSHFDKKTQTEIPTPHVQSRKINIGPNDEITSSAKSEITRPATKSDIRMARELAKRQGLMLKNEPTFVVEDDLIIETSKGFLK